VECVELVGRMLHPFHNIQGGDALMKGNEHELVARLLIACSS
jgi:hypothetical protein